MEEVLIISPFTLSSLLAISTTSSWLQLSREFLPVNFVKFDRKENSVLCGPRVKGEMMDVKVDIEDLSRRVAFFFLSNLTKEKGRNYTVIRARKKLLISARKKRRKRLLSVDTTKYEVLHPSFPLLP